MSYQILRSSLRGSAKICTIRSVFCDISNQTRTITLSSVQLSVTVPYENSRNITLSYLKTKVNGLVQWYEEFTGMDEVRLAQNRVLEAEESFKKSQEVRRNMTTSLSEIQRKLKDIYVELDNTTRGEDRYVYLITEEHKLLKEERVIQENFRQSERNERDYFAALSSSVKESHEKERAQAERTKYWSIIGSVFGTMIGIIGTSINNQVKMRELRKLIQEANSSDLISSFSEYMQKNNEHFAQISAGTAYDSKLEQCLSVLQMQVNKLEQSVKQMEGPMHVQLVQNGEEGLIIQPYVGLQDAIIDEHKKIRYLVYGVAILSMIVPFVVSKFSF